MSVCSMIACFRDLLVAASLKPGLALAPGRSLRLGFRDLLVAASLKRHLGRRAVGVDDEVSAIYWSRPH